MAARTECIRCAAPLPETRAYACEDCDTAQELAQQAFERRMLDDAVATAMRRSGLPRAYAEGERLIGSVPIGFSFAVDACLLLGTSLSGVYLWGAAKSYKTSVAAAYLAAQIRGGGRGLFVSAPRLMDDIQASYRSDDTDSRAAIIERLSTTPMLVIDDLGKEKATEHSARILFEILDGRWQSRTTGRWTIVTSNYAPNDLAFRFDIPEEDRDPLRHRLRELTMALEMKRRAA